MNKERKMEQIEYEINLPDNGTKYWYVNVKSDFKTFEAKEAYWSDYLRDRRRYASGNFFLTYKEADDVASQWNKTMRQMPPQRK